MSMISEHMDDEGYLTFPRWHREDIEERLTHKGITITDELVGKVVDHMYEYMDCEGGVNWDYIDICIDEVIDRDANR